MARRKITEEAESNQNELDQDEVSTDTGERTQLTQRMPDDLLDEVDTLADEMGMSRNAAINMLVSRGLDDF